MLHHNTQIFPCGIMDLGGGQIMYATTDELSLSLIIYFSFPNEHGQTDNKGKNVTVQCRSPMLKIEFFNPFKVR